MRPVAIVGNSCESKPYNLVRTAQLRDCFRIKGDPYSVRDTLAREPLADIFEGATVYQTFFSALSCTFSTKLPHRGLSPRPDSWKL